MKIVLALIAGFALGVAVTGFGAEGKPSAAYFIAESDVRNPAADAKIIAKLPATAQRYGGRYLARGGKIVRFEGEPPRRVVIVAFDNLDSIRAWRSAPDVKALEEQRKKIGTILRLYAVDGL